MIRPVNRRSALLLILPWLGLTACAGDELVAPGPGEVPIEEVLDGTLLITRDPSGIAPLAAEATFHTRFPVGVTISVLGPEPLVLEFPGAGTEHVIPILGLYPGIENRVELRLTREEFRALALVTEVTYPGSQVVFEARLHFKNLLSSGERSWGNFDLVYRSERREQTRSDLAPSGARA